MFPLQPSDELVFGNPSISKRDKILDDLIVDHAFMATNILNFSTTTTSNKQQGVQTTKLGGFRQGQTESKNDQCIIRNVLHRDIERKRRQEMSQLYVSLRALLPLEQIKGKRSVCDHMQEAVNYIKNMQKKIQELRIHRDKLKKLSNLSSGAESASCSNGGDNLANCVVVNPVHYGVEIRISCSIKSDSELGLSKVIAELVQRELNVFSCASTRSKETVLHKIEAEAKDMASLDLWVLQERLTNIINY